MVDANPPQIYLTISSWWIHGNSSSHLLRSDRMSNSLDARSAFCSKLRMPWNSQFDWPAPRPGVTMSSQIFIISSTIAAGWALWKAKANDRLPRSHSIMMVRVRGTGWQLVMDAIDVVATDRASSGYVAREACGMELCAQSRAQRPLFTRGGGQAVPAPRTIQIK